MFVVGGVKILKENGVECLTSKTRKKMKLEIAAVRFCGPVFLSLRGRNMEGWRTKKKKKSVNLTYAFDTVRKTQEK